MSCPDCHHDTHFPNPCSSCARLNMMCVQGVKPTGVEYDQATDTVTAKGRVELATGTESKPCCVCRFFEHDEKKLIRHLLRNRLTPNEDGTFTTPIAKDFPGRQSMVIDPKTYGWCRKNTYVVDMLATCSAWQVVRTASELESRIKG